MRHEVVEILVGTVVEVVAMVFAEAHVTHGRNREVVGILRKYGVSINSHAEIVERQRCVESDCRQLGTAVVNHNEVVGTRRET